MTEAEWQEFVRHLGENEQAIDNWKSGPPDPLATLCDQSRHRTLGHLRACQETWLQACLSFAQEPGVSLTLPHPWRLFTQKSYQFVPWDEHLAGFKADRSRWWHVLESVNRETAGKINGIPHSIQSLTRRMVLHERRHIQALDVRNEK